MGTIRHAIAASITATPLTLLEISQVVGVRQRDIPDHLAHIERSAKARGATMTIVPARCVACGFTFRKRRRYTRPSRCPACHQSRITEPRITLAEG